MIDRKNEVTKEGGGEGVNPTKMIGLGLIAIGAIAMPVELVLGSGTSYGPMLILIGVGGLWITDNLSDLF